MDPIWLHVRVTPSDDLQTEMESALMQGTDPHGVVVTELSKFPYRLFTGTWGYDLDPMVYQPGKSYTIHWRYSVQPNVMAVVRSTFVWQPVPQLPREVDGCILSGVLSRGGGVPVPGARITIEEFKDFVTLNHRVGSVDVTTDAFGAWWVELPRNSIQRVIFGEQIRTIRLPDVAAIALKDAPDYQPLDGRKDAFGYPMPGDPDVPREPPEPTPGGDVTGGGGAPVPPPVPCEAFEFVQSVPATAWIIRHTLEGKPTVSVVDVTDEPVTGDVSYPAPGLVVIAFLIPVAGIARLT
jgi:hypothetical protein